METLEIDDDTLEAIQDYIDSYPLESEMEMAEGVEFRQDGCLLIADISVYGHYENCSELHTEVPPPNIEEGGYWKVDGGSILSLLAFGTDGEELAIDDGGLDLI